MSAAEADLDGFRARLALERRCNATEAAARLGVGIERFKRVVDAAGLAPIAEEDVRKYGRILRVRYWRAGDLDELGDHVRADQELREAAIAAGLREAARKAAATRRRNIELAKVARIELELRRPRDEAGPVESLAWTLALMRVAGVWPSGLRDWRHVSDPLVDGVAELLRQARLGRDALTGMLDAVRGPALEAGRALACPATVAATLGVPIEVIAPHVPQLAGHVPRTVLAELAAEPPPWLLEARADLLLRETAAQSARELAEERSAVLESAGRAVARLDDASVAELFGLPEEAVRLLRPRSGCWSAEHVGHLIRERPRWTRDAGAAWAEVERRRERARRRLERRRGRARRRDERRRERLE
ncbi:hypothetical protein [Actinomadura sp. WMMB 499]|uniref:hypothetical protein n=1 Tax=Actinomadura sp. WMMB 499 TaxID=1219491 RepID=UPI0012451E73|nr:hypothetical protein [Actinomadura sp. WMMB 499]QFG20512.1 hypothetical protein F7P10_04380 [Actinomadura sp. WMMB 499]